MVAPAFFYAFQNIEQNVLHQLQKLRTHPWIPQKVAVRGFVYDCHDIYFSWCENQGRLRATCRLLPLEIWECWPGISARRRLRSGLSVLDAKHSDETLLSFLSSICSFWKLSQSRSFSRRSTVDSIVPGHLPSALQRFAARDTTKENQK